MVCDTRPLLERTSHRVCVRPRPTSSLAFCARSIWLNRRGLSPPPLVALVKSEQVRAERRGVREGEAQQHDRPVMAHPAVVVLVVVFVISRRSSGGVLI